MSNGDTSAVAHHQDMNNADRVPHELVDAAATAAAATICCVYR